MRVIVYVDGFNLYFRALRETPAAKWLDLRKLAATLLPNDEVVKIRYFTARITARQQDPTKALRQQVYLRALRTLEPFVSIHLGHYLSNPTRAALTNPPPGGPATVEVWKTEEKGSDVNLATYLLLDAFDGRMEKAALVSNDSDLLTAVKIARHRFGLTVGHFGPGEVPSRALRTAATFYRPIRTPALLSSQLPNELEDANGKITRPGEWR